LEPSAVPATGGTAPTAQPSTGGQNGGGTVAGVTPSQPTLFGGGTPTGGFTTPPPSDGGIFGGGAPVAGNKPHVSLNNPATSPLNLIGKLENWGVGPATQVAEVTIKVSSATGAQLKELLKKLPDGMIFELSLEKEENG
jgi:hypothetical protein